LENFGHDLALSENRVSGLSFMKIAPRRSNPRSVTLVGTVFVRILLRRARILGIWNMVITTGEWVCPASLLY